MPNETIDEIRLKAGSSTTITLKGLATAGYTWNYTTDDNNNCIKISKEFVLPGKSKAQKTGASADEVFTIHAQKKGIVNISFSQLRSWEKTTNAADEKKVKVVVE